jgi:ankyrin repeat protein
LWRLETVKRIAFIFLAFGVTLMEGCIGGQSGQSREDLWKAMTFGDVARVREIVKRNPQLANSRMGFKGGSESALGLAIAVKNREMVEILLSRGADVNDVGDAYNTGGRANALDRAAEVGFAEVIPILVAHGANPNLFCSNSGPPLAYSRNGDVVRALVKAGAVPTLRDKSQRTPLHYVCQRGTGDAADALIQAGADVKAVDAYGMTPLHFAAGNYENGRRIVDLLIANGADVNAKAKGGRTPIRYALERTNEIGKTRDPNTIEVIRILIANGATYSSEDVARIGDKEKVRALLEQKPELARNRKALLGAIYEDNYGVVKLLVERGADLNSGEGTTLPLGAAIFAGHTDIVKLLIEAGADVNQRGKFGETALHWTSMQSGNDEMAAMLLKAGADVNAASRGCGSVPNVISECSDQIEVQFKELEWKKHERENQNVQRGVPGWNGFAVGDTPLHCASRWRDQRFVKMLIASGARPDLTNQYGQTPLHYAAAFGKKENVAELLAAGADAKLRTGTGLDAMGIAEKAGNQEIVEMLRNHAGIRVSGAKQNHEGERQGG